MSNTQGNSAVSMGTSRLITGASKSLPTRRVMLARGMLCGNSSRKKEEPSWLEKENSFVGKSE